ncbi:hypothetical protein Zmor_000873 [Zophobas morio]|uniref:Transposable element P transposase-like RNase H C-terminal domain-containing protein n=1 Tax=Zophobas morio TaxID=2755281 RepID=A0AA38MR52_9CUCU|nr:hypothetical protein Zmor_000873 [Zophobas morio]
MTSTMENLRVIGKTNILPFQNAVIISNKSLLALYQYLHNAYKINYILTRRLDQDILENFFSYIRGMGGANDNPNPIDFKHRLKRYILWKHSSVAIAINTNCEKDYAALLTRADDDDEEMCLTESLFSSIIITQCIYNAPSNENEEGDIAKLEILDDSSEVRVQLTDSHLTLAAHKYVAGSEAHCFQLKYPGLGTPTENLTDTSKDDCDWIQFLSNGKLLMPCSDLLNTAKFLETLLIFHGFDN